MRARGFTLLEMLIALGIFAMIGVLASQLLRQTIDVSIAVINRGDRLVEVQRAMNILERDFEQLVTRNIRNERDELEPFLVLDLSEELRFTRAGWSNPLNHPRSTLQRVEYSLQGGVLLRQYWPVLDRANRSELITQELLTNVDSVEFSVIDEIGTTHVFWPPQEGNESGVANAPVAVRLEIEIQPFGNLSRLWLVPFLVEIQESGLEIDRDGIPPGIDGERLVQ